MQLSDEHIPAWENLLARLERPETRGQWAMEVYMRVTRCRTVGCIAFHACRANSKEPKNGVECFDVARRLLGLDAEALTVVFSGGWIPSARAASLITIDHAIAYVRRVIETRDPLVTVEV